MSVEPSTAPTVGKAERIAFDPGHARRRGHVESYFVKFTSPDAQRSLWLRWTILADGRNAPRAEIWAIAFRRGHRHVVAKRSMKLNATEMLGTPGRLSFDTATFDGSHAEGTVEGGDACIQFDVKLFPRIGPLRQYPFEWMYRASVPEVKFTTPIPDAIADGWYEVDGARIDVTGWRAMHGHNWGSRNSNRYAWCHAAGFDGADDVVFEHGSARLFKAGLELPWLGVGFLFIDGAWVRFDAPRTIGASRSRVRIMEWSFELEQGDWRVRGTASATPDLVVGLHYWNPNAPTTYCLNSKLARLELDVTGPRGQRRLCTNAAAFEIGWPSADHGIPMRA